MAEQYLTLDGDMIDAICWRHYPKNQQALAVATVYAVNHRLADRGAKLPAGLHIFLPDLPTEQIPAIINLWGSA